MISERQFATGFSSFWGHLLPATDQYIRRMNLNRDRFDYEVVANAAPGNRRGLVNESSFVLASSLHGDRHSTPITYSKCEPFLAHATDQATQKIATIEGRPPSEIEEFSNAELVEVVQLADSLMRFFDHEGWDKNHISFWPSFSGCGFVRQCVGDIMVGDTLIEVKAGDRTFRATDLRQVLTYVALEYAETESLIENVILMNPRSGTYSSTPLFGLCRALGGASAENVIREIVNFMCGMALSK